MMAYLITAIVSTLIGITAWFISRARTSALLESVILDCETKAAAAEARTEEVRQQWQQTRNDFETVQERLKEVETAKVAAETREDEAKKNLAEQKALLDEAKAKLSDTFKSLAAEVLSGNNTRFLELAQEKFKAIKEEAATDLDARKKAIEVLVGPLSETLLAYQKEAQALEEKRIREMTSIGEQLRSLAMAQTTLQGETTKLVNALKSNSVRGRWGEITLRRTAELAGMSPYCDFVEQESMTTENGRLRPDMIVKLPAGRNLVVDAKVPLSGFLDALDAKTNEEHESALMKHSRQVSQHITALSSKEYWSPFTSSLEFVVLFIPNDSFLAAAAEKNPNLIEEALTKKVVIATPTTLIALLRAIAYGWRQEQIAENAQAISALGQELSDRIGIFTDYLTEIAGGLGKAIKAYNTAVGSLEARILPSARKFKELGAGGKNEVRELQPIDQMPRALNRPDEGPW